METLCYDNCMSSHYLRFEFLQDNVTASAVLLRDAAPLTCEAITGALPLEGTARHGIYSGSEALMFIPSGISPPRENAVSRIRPGDIGFYSFEERGDHDGDQPVSEIAWFYGPDARPSMPDGPVAVNLFARFVEGFEAVADLCYRMRLEGARPLRVTLDRK